MGDRLAAKSICHFNRPTIWRSIFRFYQTHSIPGLERVTENSFARPFSIDNVIGFVSVDAMIDEPQLTVRIAPDEPEVILAVVRRVRKMFDLDCDPMLIQRSFKRIPLLASLCRRYPGLRLPRGWDPFETAICSILGQLVSAPQRANLDRPTGAQLWNAKSRIHGREKHTRWFPAAEVLANADLSAVRTTIARREAIREFSRGVVTGAISLSEDQDARSVSPSAARHQRSRPVVGRMYQLRAIGDTDAFPKTDLILRARPAASSRAESALIKPWRSYGAIYLWREFAQSLAKNNKGKKP